MTGVQTCALPIFRLGLPPPHRSMATIHRPTPSVRAANPSAPTIEPSTENSIASCRTYAPTAFSPTEFLHRLRDAETLNSFACARLSQSYRPKFSFDVPQRSPPWLLTTAACGGLRSTPDCRTRRTFLHLPYSCASPCGPTMLVTQGPPLPTCAVHQSRQLSEVLRTCRSNGRNSRL